MVCEAHYCVVKQNTWAVQTKRGREDYARRSELCEAERSVRGRAECARQSRCPEVEWMRRCMAKPRNLCEAEWRKLLLPLHTWTGCNYAKPHA